MPEPSEPSAGLEPPAGPAVDLEDRDGASTANSDGAGPEAPGEGAAPRNQARAGHGRRVAEWAIVVVLAVLVATGLRAFAIQAFYVPSGSMLPTLQIGDRIVVVKFGYSIERGDIVVFRRTPADIGTTDADLVKRVIGLPGETISSRGNEVLINGKVLKEPWLPPLQGQCAEQAEGIRPQKIPPGQYFVMGDCRGFSDDSRYWGTVPRSFIIGKVFVIVWRFGRPYFHWF